MRILKKQIEFIILYIAMLSILVGSMFYTTDSLRGAFYPLLVIGLLTILFLTLNKNKLTIENNNNTLTLLLFISMLGSCLSNNTDIDLLVSSIGFCSILFIITFLLKSYRIPNKELIFYYANITLFIGIICIPFLILKREVPYLGIFYNPNSLGNITASIYAILFSTFIIKLLQNKIDYWLLSFSIFSLYLTLTSMSRGSMVTIGFISLFFLIFYIYKAPLRNKTFFFLILVLITICMTYIILSNNLGEEIFQEFESKLERRESDVLSGRGKIWSLVLNNLTLFGLGSEPIIYDIEIGYHSTYISLLAQYGVIPTLVFLYINIKLLYTSYKYCLNSNSPFRGISFALGSVFFITGITEGMLLKYSMFAFYLSYCSFNGLNDTRSFNDIKL